MSRRRRSSTLTSTPAKTSTWGRRSERGGDQDIPRGPEGGYGPRARQGRERRPHGRGYRRLRRYPPHNGRALRRIRAQTDNGRAHLRERVYRRGSRHGDDGDAAHSRDDDLELLVPGGGPDHPERRQGALFLGRTGRGAARDPGPQRWRRPALGPTYALPGELLRPLPRSQGR